MIFQREKKTWSLFFACSFTFFHLYIFSFTSQLKWLSQTYFSLWTLQSHFKTINHIYQYKTEDNLVQLKSEFSQMNILKGTKILFRTLNYQNMWSNELCSHIHSPIEKSRTKIVEKKSKTLNCLIVELQFMSLFRM